MSDSRPLVQIVSPIPLYPQQGGGATRVLGYIRHLRASGFAVELVTVPHTSSARSLVAAEVDRLTIAHSRGGLRKRLRHHSQRLPPSFRDFLRTLDGKVSGLSASPLESARNTGLEVCARRRARKKQPLAVIAVFAWTARALDNLPPSVLKVIDTIDVQHLRADSAAAAGFDLQRTRCTAEEEAAELRRADVLLAIQQEEQAQLRSLVPQAEVILCPHAHEVAPAPLRAHVDSKELLFVGNRYEPNVDGLRIFLNSAWPAISSAVPDARLHVCGKVCEEIVDPSAGVILHGLVPELESFYARAAVVINPVPYGTGLKIKTVEALCLGKCLVTTEAGVLGLDRDSEESFVVAPADQMAPAIIDVLKDPARRAHLENAALEYARARFTPKVAYAELVKMLNVAAAKKAAV